MIDKTTMIITEWNDNGQGERMKEEKEKKKEKEEGGREGGDERCVCT